MSLSGASGALTHFKQDRGFRECLLEINLFINAWAFESANVMLNLRRLLCNGVRIPYYTPEPLFRRVVRVSLALILTWRHLSRYLGPVQELAFGHCSTWTYKCITRFCSQPKRLVDNPPQSRIKTSTSHQPSLSWCRPRLWSNIENCNLFCTEGSITLWIASPWPVRP